MAVVKQTVDLITTLEEEISIEIRNMRSKSQAVGPIWYMDLPKIVPGKYNIFDANDEFNTKEN